MLCFLENGVRSKNDANRYPRPARQVVADLAREHWQTIAQEWADDFQEREGMFPKHGRDYVAYHMIDLDLRDHAAEAEDMRLERTMEDRRAAA